MKERWGWSNHGWSYLFKPHWCDQYLCYQNTDTDFHTPPVTLHQTFHPWSSKKAPENIQRNAWSFLFTQPRRVSSVCHWTGDGQFTLCGASVSLSSRVCSSRLVMVHPAQLAHTIIQREVLFVGAMRKSQFQWRTPEHPVHWFFTRVGKDAFSNLALHSVWFLLLLVLHFLLPFVGVGFSQDQITWFQWNGISFSIICTSSVSQPLMLTVITPLWSLLTAIHITQQHSGQHAGVSSCPLSWGNKSQWVSMFSTQTSSIVGCIWWWPISWSCKHAPILVNA